MAYKHESDWKRRRRQADKNEGIQIGMLAGLVLGIVIYTILLNVIFYL